MMTRLSPLADRRSCAYLVARRLNRGSGMTRRLRKTAGVLVAAAIAVAILVPATAGAVTWQRVGAAPGADELATIRGVPYVAWTSPNGVHVAKLTTAGTWEPVGEPV